MSKVLKVVSSSLLFASLGCATEAEVDEQTTQVQSALAAAGNDYGVAETFHTSGSIDLTNPFFQALGSNPRSCATCHSPDQGWTMTAEANKDLFRATDGLAPLFNLVDEGITPTSDISTKRARKATFGPQTIDLALTRFTRAWPPAAGADFTLTAVADPSGFSTLTSFLNYRRPTATANESKVSSTGNTAGPVQDIPVQLANLMRGAAQLHEQRDPATRFPSTSRTWGVTSCSGSSWPRSSTTARAGWTPRARSVARRTSPPSRSRSA